MLYFDFLNEYKLLKLLKVSHSNFCDSWFKCFCYDKIQMIKNHISKKSHSINIKCKRFIYIYILN